MSSSPHDGYRAPRQVDPGPHLAQLGVRAEVVEADAAVISRGNGERAGDAADPARLGLIEEADEVALRRRAAQQRYGRTWEELAGARAAVRPFLLDRAQEARGLLETLSTVRSAGDQA